MGVPSSPEAIVSFDDPPVVEVVASVQFDGLSDASIFSVGAHWEQSLRDEFPNFSLQPPYEMPQELFQKPEAPTLNLQFSVRPPLPRLWLSGQEGEQSELMQVQQDWFALNWRKVGPNAKYDRWPQRRAAFKSRWDAFFAWAASRGDVLTPKQFEVTYINHIRPIGGLWEQHSESSKVFAFGLPTEVGGYGLEQSGWNADYLAPANVSAPARTHLSVKPGFTRSPDSPEPLPILIFEITARGPVPAADRLLECLDQGRNSIVRSFVAVTSDEAKTAWGVRHDDRDS
jgi:uncharacterized protein (TIGR04255 family)